MNAEKIVKALRLCVEKEDTCTSCVTGQLDCPFGETIIGCEQRMKRAAADKLEELNTFMNSQYTKLLEKCSAAQARIAELEVELEKCTRARERQGERLEEERHQKYGMIEAVSALQARDKEAMELLRLAEHEAWMRCDCNYCAVRACARLTGTRRKCLAGDGNWKWQYADRYNALTAQEPDRKTEG